MRRILIYGDVDLNVIDGSSVWLVNLARLLSQEQDIYVDILLKKRIRRDMLVRQTKRITVFGSFTPKNTLIRSVKWMSTMQLKSSAGSMRLAAIPASSSAESRW